MMNLTPLMKERLKWQDDFNAACPRAGAIHAEISPRIFQKYMGLTHPLNMRDPDIQRAAHEKDVVPEAAEYHTLQKEYEKRTGREFPTQEAAPAAAMTQADAVNAARAANWNVPALTPAEEAIKAQLMVRVKAEAMMAKAAATPDVPIGTSAPDAPMTAQRRRQLLEMSGAGDAVLQAEAKAEAQAWQHGQLQQRGLESGMTEQRRRELLAMSGVGGDVLRAEGEIEGAEYAKREGDRLERARAATF